MATFITGKIAIEIPVEQNSQFADFFDFWTNHDTSTIKDLFEVENKYLWLTCNRPEDYIPMSKGEGLSIYNGWNKSIVRGNSKRLGFKMKVKDTRSDLRIAIEQLMDLSVEKDCSNATAIKIYDYCYLRTIDDRNRFYRVRVGFFEGGLEDVTGNFYKGTRNRITNVETVIDAYNRHESGFSFTFFEVEPTVFY